MDQGVGREVKRLREQRDWSQAKLAVEAEMSVSGVSMIENGQRNLTTTTLAKLANAFGINIAELFPKTQAPLPELEDERRESTLADAADDLLITAMLLLQTWEAELPDRAEANDVKWLQTIAATWHLFGRIFYGVTKVAGPGGVHDLEAWFARYMDVNAAAHRLNAAILEHTEAEESLEEDAITLEPLARA